ncbi:MAG TPA: hypothetical protein VLT79_04665 [Gemmatimonadales bacterium]|nr:hypothetical protein [Gemmatimonadales bacterium]
MTCPVTVRAQIAVVVNRANPIQNLSLSDLRRLYLGQSVTFANGTRVALVTYPPAQARFYNTVLGLSEDRFQRHWMELVFQGQDATPPKAIAVGAELNRFVAEHPGALAFVDLPAVDQSVKIVTIDGQAPTDTGYRLH